ncbi:MAG: hypothetical protein ACTH1D_00270 [Mycobacteriaceae bacterium]|uniref:hypothetical protein n=1 Tax=Corynebacterium sp. TaxID=1720 RepID=UPI003F9C8EF0
MTTPPDLESVLTARRDAFATPTVPRIGVDTTTDRAGRAARVQRVLDSTTGDLHAIAESRQEKDANTFSVGEAVVYTLLTIAAAAILPLVGVWLVDVGMGIDLSGSESTS